MRVIIEDAYGVAGFDAETGQAVCEPADSFQQVPVREPQLVSVDYLLLGCDKFCCREQFSDGQLVIISFTCKID